MPNTSQSSAHFDLEAQVTLRLGTDAPETATAAEVAVDMKASGQAWWQEAQQTFRYMEVMFNVNALDLVNLDETYVLSIEVAQDAAFTLGVTEVGTTTATATGYYPVVVSGDAVDKAAPGSKFMRVKATLAGTTPSISYSAYIAPVIGAH